MDPLTVLAALGPLAVDLGKSLINRFIAPDQFKPATIDQYVQMKQIDLEFFRTMNEAGGGNPSYPWVEAIVRLMRPAIGLIVLGTWAYLTIYDNGIVPETVNNFASVIGFYLFGERSLFYVKSKKQKADMALSKLVFKPGINRDQTNYATEGGWFACDKIRFRSGFPEKIGGWVVQTFTPYSGAARAIFPWNTSTGQQITAIGTNEKIYLNVGSSLIDITPIRITYNTSSTPSSNNCISTTLDSDEIVLNITGNGAEVGDYVIISGAAAVGGIPASYINKEFRVIAETINTVTVSTKVLQTGTYSQSGTTVTITSTAHGLTSGQKVNFTPLTGEANAGNYTVTVTNPDTFTVTSGTSETTSGNCEFYIVGSSTVASGGGTAIVVNFLISPGNDNVTAGYGWGTGGWSRGTWGSGTTSPVLQDARLVFFQNFNNDLMFNIRGGDIYYWTFDPTYTTRAVLLKDIGGAIAVPEQVTRIIFAASGHLLALGCTEYDAATPPAYTGPYDSLLVRWASVDADIGPEPENWKPELTNTAGFFRLQSGSRIVTAINTRQETLVWTNTSLYSIQFLGTTEVFSQQPLSAHISIIGPNVVAGANNISYWMGNDKFYTYSGRVDTLPCTLRQYVFTDINREQGQIFFCGSNAQFNEVIWFYCSANANQIDRYVVYNYAENIWYYGQIARTCWVDAGNTQYPLAAQNGWVYQHENGTDDGQPNGAPPLPINAFIQSADIDITDGDNFMLTRRIIPDVNFTASETTNPVTGAPITPQATITVGVRNFPGAVSEDVNVSGVSTANQVITSVTVDQYTNQVFVRARGRQMNFRISSDNVGTQWQLGMPRLDARPDGRRG